MHEGVSALLVSRAQTSADIDVDLEAIIVREMTPRERHVRNVSNHGTFL